MNYKIIITTLIFSLLIVSACAQTTLVPEKDTSQEPVGVDVVSEIKKIKVIEEEVEETKEEIKEVVDEEEISEVEELLSIVDKKVESLRYSYKGQETKDFFYEFFVKGNKIKYILDPPYKVIDVDDDAYDTIYINKESRTALAYCDNKKCRVKGKKAVLDYDENYILTPFDWLNKIESAEIVGERLIDRRNTMKLTTNDFSIWIDTFFGVPLQVETVDNLYKFEKMSFNGVKDEDVSVKG
ncbi:MAG: hypothetical protein IH934_05570 [Nanoarchaeota archaeon]|nr:hypothetical protein [Nanoarchaeota archaeon]